MINQDDVIKDLKEKLENKEHYISQLLVCIGFDKDI